MLVFKKRQVDQEKMFRTTLQISIFKKKRLTKKYDFFFCYLFGTKMIQLWIVRGAPKKWLFQFFFRQFLHIILKFVLFSRLIFNLNLPKNSGQPKISFKIVIFKKRGGGRSKGNLHFPKNIKTGLPTSEFICLIFSESGNFENCFRLNDEWYQVEMLESHRTNLKRLKISSMYQKGGTNQKNKCFRFFFAIILQNSERYRNRTNLGEKW